MRIAIATLALALVSMPREAWVSQVHYRKITLEDVLARSTLVVVGKRLKPDEHAGYQPGDEVYSVVEVLKGPAERRQKAVRVEPFERPIQQAMAASYRQDGTMRSPIIDTYESSLDEKRYLGAIKSILFLTCDTTDANGPCRFAAKGAYEASGRRVEIIALLAAKR